MNSEDDRAGGPQAANLCGVCGGDGRLENAWGQIAKCPSCHGNGRRREDTGFHDVTKTKASHHRQSNVAAVAQKQTTPASAEGILLAKEINASGLSAETKTRLIREVLEHEATHGHCTKTFMKKTRRQFRPAT